MLLYEMRQVVYVQSEWCVFIALVSMQHFAVMDASENQVFLAVEHSDGSHVHLYLSDADGVNYAFSLEDVVTTADWGSGKPSFDIHAVNYT